MIRTHLNPVNYLFTYKIYYDKPDFTVIKTVNNPLEAFELVYNDLKQTIPCREVHISNACTNAENCTENGEEKNLYYLFNDEENAYYYDPIEKTSLISDSVSVLDHDYVVRILSQDECEKYREDAQYVFDNKLVTIKQRQLELFAQQYVKSMGFIAFMNGIPLQEFFMQYAKKLGLPKIGK